MWRALFWSLVLAACPACGFGDLPLEEVDPEAAPANPTWTADVKPLMEIYCTACHAEDAQPGELEGVGYDTCEKTRRHWRGLYSTTFESKTMPPGGAPRPLPWELLTLERWHAQGAPCD